MPSQLIKSIKYNESLDIMYMAKDGAISRRRIEVLETNEDPFQAYCFLRGSKRTFRIDNALALVPVVQRESMVI